MVTKAAGSMKNPPTNLTDTRQANSGVFLSDVNRIYLAESSLEIHLQNP